MDVVRIQQAPARVETDAVPGTVTIAAWNLERCKHVAESALLMKRHKVDIALLTEMDIGMARSGNIDTVSSLGQHLSMGHAFSTEFIELGLGDLREQQNHSDQLNASHLHGNAVISRYPFQQAAVIPLDKGGLWFDDPGHSVERRVGGRVATATRILLPKPIWFITVHFESRGDPESRSSQCNALLAMIDVLCDNDPVIIGGDFNCNKLRPENLGRNQMMSHPETLEPMFKRLACNGFQWKRANTDQMTTRAHPWHDDSFAAQKIDWFFSRDVQCHNPRVVPAVDRNGVNLSDHELLLVDIEP